MGLLDCEECVTCLLRGVWINMIMCRFSLRVEIIEWLFCSRIEGFCDSHDRAVSNLLTKQSGLLTGLSMCAYLKLHHGRFLLLGGVQLTLHFGNIPDSISIEISVVGLLLAS